MPTSAELARYYEQYDVLGEREPYYRALWQADALQTPEGRDIIERMNWLLGFVRPSTLLDVGSGPGLFLRLMKEKGVTVAGVELNKRAAERSARDHGLSVHAGTIFDNNKKFDCITFWDLLEHVNDPRALLRKAFELTNPGGWIFIETPNEASLLDRAVCFLKRMGLSAPANTFYGLHHLELFRAPTVRRLLEETGYKIVQIRGGETTVSRIFRTASLTDRLMRAGLKILFIFARIFGRRNKMLIAARKPELNII